MAFAARFFRVFLTMLGHYSFQRINGNFLIQKHIPSNITCSSNKQSLFKRYGTWMTMFSTNPYFIIIQRFECYTTLIVKELLYNKKSHFLFLFQKVS